MLAFVVGDALALVDWPVYFNHQGFPGAVEVNHERPDWMLPPELSPSEPSVAQCLP